MRLSTGVVVIQGLAHVLVGIFTPWTAALTQWINSGQWPEKIVWVGVILPLSAIGGGSALVAFLSGSFKQFQQQKKADDTGQRQVQVTEPAAPAKPISETPVVVLKENVLIKEVPTEKKVEPPATTP